MFFLIFFVFLLNCCVESAYIDLHPNLQENYIRQMGLSRESPHNGYRPGDAFLPFIPIRFSVIDIDPVQGEFQYRSRIAENLASTGPSLRQQQNGLENSYFGGHGPELPYEHKQQVEEKRHHTNPFDTALIIVLMDHLPPPNTSLQDLQQHSANLSDSKNHQNDPSTSPTNQIVRLESMKAKQNILQSPGNFSSSPVHQNDSSASPTNQSLRVETMKMEQMISQDMMKPPGKLSSPVLPQNDSSVSPNSQSLRLESMKVKQVSSQDKMKPPGNFSSPVHHQNNSSASPSNHSLRLESVKVKPDVPGNISSTLHRQNNSSTDHNLSHKSLKVKLQESSSSGGHDQVSKPAPNLKSSMKRNIDLQHAKSSGPAQDKPVY